jgi:predicted RNA-binding Zn ribbon-like protein
MQTNSSAPGPLDLVRLFINTSGEDVGVDAIDSPDRLVDWLAAHGLAEPGTAARAADVENAADLREALRALARTNNGCGADPGAARRLAAHARRVRLAVTFGPSGATITAHASGADAALGTLLAITARAMHDGGFARLKACYADDCAWAYYDHSRNNTRAWCSMQVCGNRHKIRAYRERQRGAATPLD